jgi:hypothetical protein
LLPAHEVQAAEAAPEERKRAGAAFRVEVRGHLLDLLEVVNLQFRINLEKEKERF